MTTPNGKKTLNVSVPRQVFASDVVGNLSQSELVTLTRRIVGSEASDVSNTTAEELVHALLELRLPEGPLGDWTAACIDAGLDATWLDTLIKLRVINHKGFCVVYELRTVKAELFSVDEHGKLLVTKAKAAKRPSAGAVYTLDLNVAVAMTKPGAARTIPRGTKQVAPRRPYPSDPGDARAMENLAQHLAPRVIATLGGAERVREHPVLAALCAMTGSVLAVMKATSKDDAFRQDVLDACLDALDLADHRTTAERLLLRDHEAHVHVDVSALPDRMASSNWNGGLGLFAEDAKGQLVKVTTEMRKNLMPRVLFSLCEPEPH